MQVQNKLIVKYLKALKNNYNQTKIDTLKKQITNSSNITILDKTPLGSGGMADVFKCSVLFEGEKRTVAIKMVDLKYNENYNISFMEQITPLISLNSEYIVSIVIIGSKYIEHPISGNICECIAFEYIDGSMSLEQFIEKKRIIFTEIDVTSIIYSLIKGLKVFHKNGYKHGDFGYQNILISPNYHINIIDPHVDSLRWKEDIDNIFIKLNEITSDSKYNDEIKEQLIRHEFTNDLVNLVRVIEILIQKSALKNHLQEIKNLKTSIKTDLLTIDDILISFNKIINNQHKKKKIDEENLLKLLYSNSYLNNESAVQILFGKYEISEELSIRVILGTIKKINEIKEKSEGIN